MWYRTLPFHIYEKWILQLILFPRLGKGKKHTRKNHTSSPTNSKIINHLTDLSFRRMPLCYRPIWLQKGHLKKGHMKNPWRFQLAQYCHHLVISIINSRKHSTHNKMSSFDPNSNCTHTACLFPFDRKTIIFVKLQSGEIVSNYKVRLNIREKKVVTGQKSFLSYVVSDWISCNPALWERTRRIIFISRERHSNLQVQQSLPDYI